MKYKNLSNQSRTFHGITIEPGEIKNFPGLVNHKDMFLVVEAEESTVSANPSRTPKNTKPTKEEKPNGKNNNK